jgi:thiol:disulfide interchange protein DsbC
MANWNKFSTESQVNRVKTIKSMLLGGLVFLLAASAVADRAADEAVIRKALGQIEASSIKPTPVAGIYEVVVGPHVVYMSADGRHMFQGELIDVNTRQSLTAPSRRQAIGAVIDEVSEEKMIVYEPEKTKHTITVFTDIDCGYCRKLHNEMQSYLDKGIRVRYLFYPRAGPGSASYNKAVAAWCADDRQEALTTAKNGEPIAMKSCANPVDEHMALGEKLGVRGTPFVVLESGDTQPGYAPAAQMARLLDQLARQR